MGFNNRQIDGYLQVTLRCNQNCIFCAFPTKDEEMDFEKIKKYIFKYADQRVSQIVLTGGEPTERKDLSNIIAFAKSFDFTVKIITNGVNLHNKKYLNELIRAGLDSVAISVHSHIKEMGDVINNTPGNFEKTIEGIKNAIDSNIMVALNITINSKNYFQLPDFARFIVKDLKGISFVTFNFIDAVGRAGNNPELVPKICDVELYLNKAMNILYKNKIMFHVERVPLCYLVGFENNCSETIKFVNDEFIRTSRIEHGPIKPQKYKKGEILDYYSKFNVCKQCSLNLICAGLDNHYVKVKGFQEIYPRFVNVDTIEKNF